MSTKEMLRHPSAYLPLVISLGALGVVLAHLVVNGTAPQADEGAAARIWQLLMAAQVPILVGFSVKWLPHAPRQGAVALALQLAGLFTAALPVNLLHW